MNYPLSWSYEWNLVVWTSWIIFHDTHIASWIISTLFFRNKNFKAVKEKFHRISPPLQTDKNTINQVFFLWLCMNIQINYVLQWWLVIKWYENIFDNNASNNSFWPEIDTSWFSNLLKLIILFKWLIYRNDYLMFRGNLSDT